MPKRAIDTSTWFSQIAYDRMPETQDIEDPNVDIVPVILYLI